MFLKALVAILALTSATLLYLIVIEVTSSSTSLAPHAALLSLFLIAAACSPMTPMNAVHDSLTHTTPGVWPLQLNPFIRRCNVDVCHDYALSAFKVRVQGRGDPSLSPIAVQGTSAAAWNLGLSRSCLLMAGGVRFASH